MVAARVEPGQRDNLSRMPWHAGRAGVGRAPPFLALRVSLVAVAGALVACARAREGELAAPAFHRLLEAGATGAVSGAAPPADSRDAAEWARLGSPPPGGEATRVLMAGVDSRSYDSRVALVASPGTIYRYRAEVPDGAVLRLGLGYPRPKPGQPSHRLRYRISARAHEENGAAAGSGERTLLEEAATTSRDGRWLDRELALTSWAGETVELSFALEGDPGAVGAWSAPELFVPGERPDGWDVILVSLDTLRADRLGAYGYSRPTSPRLDALAREGVLFRTAIAQAPWTRPSHASMLMSRYPGEAGRATTPTLAEALWRAGWRTTALTGGGQVDFRFDIFQRGFESFQATHWIDDLESVVRLLEAGRSRRELLFLHTYKVHDPYVEATFTAGMPRGRLGPTFGKKDWERLGKRLGPEERRYVSALYDGGVAWVDERLGALFDRLRAEGLLDRAVVIVTSDHGEQFWEHGSWRHGMNVYDHQLHVPLIVRLPPALARSLAPKGGDQALRGLVIADQVQLVDLYPTLLEMLGLPPQPQLSGRSLRPLLAGGTAREREALAENTNIPTYERKTLRTSRFKFIVSTPRPWARRKGMREGYELFDLRRDPGEKVDLAARHPEVAAFLHERLKSLLGGGERTMDEELPAGLDAELEAQLRALGYGGGG